MAVTLKNANLEPILEGRSLNSINNWRIPAYISREKFVVSLKD